MLDKKSIIEIRKDFPYLENAKGHIYLDNAATSQKPKAVMDAVSDYYLSINGNPHRGAHYFSMQSTQSLEGAREKIAAFINAKKASEIVFVRNATEGLNLIAYSWAMENLKDGDEILISIMEHHSNFVTWQRVCEKTGAVLKILYLNENMQISDEEFDSKLSEKTKIFSITLASNVLASFPRVSDFSKKLREKASDAIIVLDAAQYAPHHKLDVQELDPDFLVFSGHKMLSPTGIGILYGKDKVLNNMKPFMYGGDMIEYVYEDRASFLPSPSRFEAGTLNVGGAVGLAKAIDYIQEIGIDEIFEYESYLCDYAIQRMRTLDYIEIYTTTDKVKSPVVTFNFKEVHPHDVASILDNAGIAIRSGHHCTQPLHRKLGINFSARASFAFYNTIEEIDELIKGLDDVRRLMKI